MHKIPINFALATEAATILKPKFVRIKVHLPSYAFNQVWTEIFGEIWWFIQIIEKPNSQWVIGELVS